MRLKVLRDLINWVLLTFIFSFGIMARSQFPEFAFRLLMALLYWMLLVKTTHGLSELPDPFGL